VRVKVLNPDGFLKPEMNATVSFLSSGNSAATQSSGTAPAASKATSGLDRTAIRVPATAVRDGVVFVVENGKARKVTVAIEKLSGGSEVEVRSGLIGGEDLIVSPPDTLQDGASVKATESKS